MGIGLATCQELHARGADVVAISRDPSKASTVIDGIRLGALDARDSDAVSAFFENEGKIDILISSATGGTRASPRFHKDICLHAPLYARQSTHTPQTRKIVS